VSAKDGISVRNRWVGFDPSYDSFLVNVPWMSVPFEVISFTVPALTWSWKNGLYGTRMRETGSVASEPR
jgi:hypothetical protein